MVSCLGNDLTNNALTVQIEVISFGNSALFVSLRYCKNTRPDLAKNRTKQKTNEYNNFTCFKKNYTMNSWKIFKVVNYACTRSRDYIYFFNYEVDSYKKY